MSSGSLNELDIEKASKEHIESVEDIGASSGHHEEFGAKSHQTINHVHLSQEHKDYLLKRHGTLELDPLPSMDPKDPLNWPDWKKNFTIALIAFQTMSSSFMAAGLTPAYSSMAKEYGVTVSDASYLTSAQLITLGVVPLFWIPIMNTYGRNGFLTISTLFCCALNIGGGFCKTYGAQMATRVLVALFIATGTAAGSPMVSSMTFSHERGRKNGIWSLALITGTPLGPFFTGFIQYHVGTKYIYFTFAVMNFFQFVFWLFADETVYISKQVNPKSDEDNFENVVHQRHGILKLLKLVETDKKLSWRIFFKCLKQGIRFNVSMAVIAASVSYCYANVCLIVELPKAIGTIFDLNSQQISLQYISLILGSLIGEILAGPLSDYWMKLCINKRSGRKVIVDRLWVSYNGFILIIVGLIVWGVTLQNVKNGHWIISPLIGNCIAAIGNNIVATVLTAFAIDSDPSNSSDISVYLNLIRHIYGFIGPFYFPYMFDSLNFAGSAGLMCGLVAVFGAGVIIITHLVGIRREHVSISPFRSSVVC